MVSLSLRISEGRDERMKPDPAECVCYVCMRPLHLLRISFPTTTGRRSSLLLPPPLTHHMHMDGWMAFKLRVYVRMNGMREVGQLNRLLGRGRESEICV